MLGIEHWLQSRHAKLFSKTTKKKPKWVMGLIGETLTDGLGVGAEMERNLLGVKACVQSWRMGRSWNGKESEVGNRKISPG